MSSVPFPELGSGRAGGACGEGQSVLTVVTLSPFFCSPISRRNHHRGGSEDARPAAAAGDCHPHPRKIERICRQLYDPSSLYKYLVRKSMDPAACLSSAVGTQPNTIARVSGDKVCAAHAGPGRKRLLLDQRKCHVSRFAFCCRGFCGNAAWARLLRQ